MTRNSITNSDIIIAEEDLQKRVRELAAQITNDYANRELDVITLINGGSMLTADLVRHVDIPIRQHYLGFTSYAKGNSTGEVRITLDVTEPLNGRHLLLIDGIVVSGRTPSYIVEMMKLRQPASIALCVVGVKRKTVIPSLQIAYSGFDFGPEIVVGYGIGEGPHRTQPYLGRSKE